MGCWGITAFESDVGLDALGFIRVHLPTDGKLKLENIISQLKSDEWNAPENVSDGNPHSSPMMLAEVMVKFLDRDIKELDFGQENKKKPLFSSISSFTATKESVQWIRDYLSDTLKYSRERANDVPRSGWFKEQDWLDWQEHMEFLIHRMDLLLAATEISGELLDMENSGEENFQKQMSAVCEQKGHLWQESNADHESGTSNLECKRCCETMTLKW